MTGIQYSNKLIKSLRECVLAHSLPTLRDEVEKVRKKQQKTETPDPNLGVYVEFVNAPGTKCFLDSEFTSAPREVVLAPFIFEPNLEPALWVADALNSVVAQAKEDQTIQNWYAYSPYGESQSLGDGGGNPLQYTGRENDGTGLYYYRARYYDPRLKQFISDDPIGLAGGVNYRSYVNGNPVVYTDPSGRYIWIAGGAIAGGIFGGIAGAAQAIASGQSFSQIAVATATGAAGGAVTGAFATSSWIITAGLGAAVSGISNVINQQYSTGCVNWTQAGKATLSGFAGGALGAWGGSAVFGNMANPAMNGSAFGAAQFAQTVGAAISTVGSNAVGAVGD
ncbi:MAG: RHS repeat-associated core domain-containing protein [Rhodocyclaceae bacterium]|nr:RHS repeat-associated core domain-containing protein [Rhodocyclaceae bacterium]